MNTVGTEHLSPPRSAACPHPRWPSNSAGLGGTSSLVPLAEFGIRREPAKGHNVAPRSVKNSLKRKRETARPRPCLLAPPSYPRVASHQSGSCKYQLLPSLQVRKGEHDILQRRNAPLACGVWMGCASRRVPKAGLAEPQAPVWHSKVNGKDYVGLCNQLSCYHCDANARIFDLQGGGKWRFPA